MRLGPARKLIKYELPASDQKSPVIGVNVFQPERLADIDLIKNYRGKFKFKIYKIAIVIGLLIIPLITFASDINKANIIKLTNADRQNNNLPALVESSELDSAAQAKANDMIANQYFEHYSPDGKTPWQFIESAHYDYTYAGENLAMDFKTAEGANTGWMNSGSHKKNILNPKYNDIGIGVIKGNFNGHPTTIIVQMFGSKKNSWLVEHSDFIDSISSLIGLSK